MDLSFLDKFFLVEDTRINIIANIIFKNVKDNIDNKSLKYINHFNKNKDIYPQKMIIYHYFLNLIFKFNCLILDTKPLLDGEILNNEYNNIMPEDSIILLYLKVKLYCSTQLNKFFPRDINGNHFIISQINKYESLFNSQELKLLEKDIDTETKKNLLLKEFKKTKILKISMSIIISYYFFRFKKDELKEFEIFISKVQDLTDQYIKINLNMNLTHFWEYLITSI
jgi:hypothetical protein